MFSLIVLGDWVSFYLAMLTEVDPTPIPSIDRLKAALS
jgi:glucose/mannose-6-phosphate isomerase